MRAETSGGKGSVFFAVLDIGKTNKKIAIFDEKLNLVCKESVQMGEKIVDGVLADPIEEMNEWLIAKLKSLSSKFNIKSIGITTFGATVAMLGKNGGLAFPVISYNHDAGEENRKKFHEKFGGADELYMQTATPAYGQFLNSAVQIFWLNENFPDRFGKVSEALFLPQYEGKMLTGVSSIEPTYLGCHNYLYDFSKKRLSSVALGLGLDKKMPKRMSNPWDPLGKLKSEICGKTGIGNGCTVAVGMHDSNASLLPYLLKENESFLLASTGTWCVFMQPGAKFHLSKKDMEKDTLYFMDAFARPNRASIFRGGKEHDHYSGIIQEKFGMDPRKFKLNKELLEKILRSNSSFVIPTLIPGSGQFPKSKARIVSEGEFYESAERAYHVLNLSIAIQSYYAIMQVSGRGSKCPIFVEGGFANNEIYLALLSTLFSERDVYVTEIKEATSLGAAICAKCAFEGKGPQNLDPNLIEIRKNAIPKISGIEKHLKAYVQSFERHCKGGQPKNSGRSNKMPKTISKYVDAVGESVSGAMDAAAERISQKPLSLQVSGAGIRKSKDFQFVGMEVKAYYFDRQLDERDCISPGNFCIGRYNIFSGEMDYSTGDGKTPKCMGYKKFDYDGKSKSWRMEFGPWPASLDLSGKSIIVRISAKGHNASSKVKII